MALLEVRDVSKHFPGVQALRNVSLNVEAGEALALVGENGAGKSTLVKIISGAQRPDSGHITFDGFTFEVYSPSYATDHGISVVHQRQQLVPWLSVEENILLGQQPERFGLIDKNARRRIARELLDRLRVSINPAELFGKLSPAQQQEIVIAKALYRKARLIILDEPTAALDPEQIERLFELINELCAQNVAILYISHHMEEIFQLANRITILRDGQVVTTRPTRELTQGEVVDMMAGHHVKVGADVEAVPTPASTEPASVSNATPLLELRKFSAGAVLRDIEVAISAGEVVGITGIVGAGGHDLAMALFGQLPQTGGQCLLKGETYAPHKPAQAIEQGVFLVPENPARDGLVGQMSVAKNMTLADLPAITRLGVLQLRNEVKLAHQYVSSLHIATASIDREVRTLSGGNQQKVLLAKALQAKAHVLVLEEPTQGVDVNTKEEIHRIIRELAAAGKAVLVISTDILDLLQFTDRMLVLRKGRLVADLQSTAGDYTQILNLTLGT